MAILSESRDTKTIGEIKFGGLVMANRDDVMRIHTITIHNT